MALKEAAEDRMDAKVGITGNDYLVNFHKADESLLI